MHKLDPIFSPKSVAVLGASGTPGKVGHDIFRNILLGGYRGVLYPVNPNVRSILCIKAYPTLLDVPDDVDLGMIVLPPLIALNAAEDCIKRNVKGIVIISAGFREVGNEGLEIERLIVSMCRDAGVPLVGPNCLGVINPHPDVMLNASFSTRMPASGNISFISQSGALCTAVLDFAADRGFGFSKFISIGNKADVDELDLLKYYHEDPQTDVIMVYMEELRRCGQGFIDEVIKITSGEKPTPILVIKSGITTAGASAAASHTGAVAGTEAIYRAIFEESGIIRVNTVNELFDLAIAFAHKKVPQSNRIAIVTNAGGPGIVATDVTETAGLRLARFKEETIEELASRLPSTANLHNPVDIIGDASHERYESALKAVIKDEDVDGVLVILTPQSMTNVMGTAETIVRISKRTPKPIVCSFMGIIDVSAGVKILQDHQIPVYRFPENAAQALGALYRHTRWLDRQHIAQFTLTHDSSRASDIIQAAMKQGLTCLNARDAEELLRCYGFHVLPASLAKTQDEAAAIAEGIGFPVALKVISPQIIHKTEARGVKTGLDTQEDVRDAFSIIIKNAKVYNPKTVIDGILVQKMAEHGEEVIMGMKRYPVFGPLLMFGLGGIFVELFKDVVFRIAPIDRNNANQMIKGIKGLPILEGFRGRPKTDMETLQRLLVSLSDMVLKHTEIKEMDINPLFVHAEGKGASAVDVRIILGEPDPAPCVN
ncbi:acetate--CoA ligase family protein [bacterium]|nr:acetate--CoA ligase family protein [bacterium]